MTKLLLLLSDSHVGRWTERSNLKVVGLQFRKVGTELMQALKQTPDCDEVIVALLGDIVEGENIYPAQEHFLDQVNPDLLKQVFPYLEGLRETSSVHTLLQAYLAAQFILPASSVIRGCGYFGVAMLSAHNFCLDIRPPS